MPAKQKTPVVKLEPHYRTKQRLIVNGKTKIAADKILSYELFDKGNKIAVLFKDKKSASNQVGVNLAIIHLDEDVWSFVLLDPQPEPEEEASLLPNGHIDDDKNIMIIWRKEKNIYAMDSKDPNAIAGPFTSEEVWERYVAADYRFTFKEVYEALIRESRHK